MVQVKTTLKGRDSQNSYGTGFYVRGDGLIITNYHVVSQYIVSPYQYDLTMPNNQGGLDHLILLDFDVANDIALLKNSKKHTDHFLAWSQTVPRKGEKLYSIGNPNELGTAVVEGTYNGFREDSYNRVIHFTGSINSGMSGGPVLNHRGQVIGVNDATMREGRGFLIPAEFAQNLVHHYTLKDVEPTAEQLHKKVEDQIVSYSHGLTQYILQHPMKTQLMGRFMVPVTTVPFMTCWGKSSDDNTQLFHINNLKCEGSSAMYIQDDIHVGMIQYTQRHYRSDSMGPFRLGLLIKSQTFDDFNDFYSEGSENFRATSCNTHIFRTSVSLKKVITCVKSYKRYPGIYDTRVQVLQPLEGEALVSNLSLLGMTSMDSQSLIRQLLLSLP